MSRRILVLQGHPDPRGGRFGHALADAYAAGAVAAGHDVKCLALAGLDFPLLRTQEEFNNGLLPPGLKDVQAAIGWADHVVLFFPLWLGTMPALVKAFLEQVLRPGFAFRPEAGGDGWKPALGGKSARLVVTMGMPAAVYRGFFLSHGVKGLERNILRFCGFKPVHSTFVGMVEVMSPATREKWLGRVGALGRRGG